MRKITCIAVLIAILLSLMTGCSILTPAETTLPPASQTTSETTPLTQAPETTVPPETTEATSETTPPSLFDNTTPASSEGNVVYVSNEHFESMESPRLRLFGDSIILYGLISQNDEFATEIKNVSLITGELLGQTVVNSGSVSLFTGNGQIGVCSSMTGEVFIFSPELEQTAHYSVETTAGTWALSSDFSTLYRTDWSEGFTAVNLETGAAESLIDSPYNLYSCTELPNQLTLCYTDGKTQKNVFVNFDLTTGTFREIPHKINVNYSSFCDGTWIIGDGANWGDYYIHGNGTLKYLQWDGSSFEQDLATGYLRAVDNTTRTVKLYSPDGEFISACTLPEDIMAYIDIDFIWSDLWNGFFFSDVTTQGTRLAFWDVSASVEGEDLQLTEVSDKTPAIGTVVPQALYERAAEISERFGIEVYIAEFCALDYPSFTATMATDYTEIAIALDILDFALASYPEGYLEQLAYGNIQSIRIELVSELFAENTDDYSGSYSAFAHEAADHHLVVFETATISEYTVFHEFTHVTDRRLAWDASLRPDALFSEEAWLALQPEGFVFAETYGESDIDLYNPAYDAYFMRAYSRRFATEDRATLVEQAANRNYSAFTEELKAKLEFYAACIRDCFDTTGWPETVRWEEVLRY
ncbi:MAG: hypothetical protein IKZ19_06255 [Clostridia bacterium]|nr:hypothetical protein [Clostridia bacterium]